MARAVSRRCKSARQGVFLRTIASSATALLFACSTIPAQSTADSLQQQQQQPPQVVTVQVPAPTGTPANSADWSQSAQTAAQTTGQTAGQTPGRSTTNNGIANDAAANQSATPQPAPSEFQRLVYRTLGTEVPIFGSDLFRNSPSTFAPVTGTQVTGDYVIGPGDEIRLSATGQLNQQGTFTVDRAGTITIPQVGTLTVAGLRFDDLKPFLVQQMNRVYRNFQLNVALGQLRSIQVYVTGEARHPGAYTVSSLSTLLNAVFASGGVLPQGSLRAIQLQRGNRTVVTLDMYDLLLRGDKSKDVRLQPGDVIFIPRVGPQVAVVGSVTDPAIYELRGETTVKEALSLANGINSTAQETDARVESIFNHSNRTVAEVNLAKDGGRTLQDGDILTVTSISGEFRNAVTVRGNVTSPGRFAWHEGMRVTDVIPNRNALLTRAYFGANSSLVQNRNGVPTSPTAGDAATMATPTPTTTTTTTNTTANTVSTPLATVPTSASTSSRAATGQAANTNGSGTSVGDALTQNNGAFPVTNQVVLSSPDVDLAYAVIERLDMATLTTSLVPFNLGKALDGDPAQNQVLQPGDVITVFSKADIRVPQTQQTRFVRLEGEFLSSGIYSVLPGETLRQLVARAGGVTPEAYLYGSEFTRESTRRIEAQRLREYADTLDLQINNQVGSEVAGPATQGGTSVELVQQQANAATAGARALAARLRAAQPSGRIVLNLKPTSTGLNAIPDIALEDGDRFLIPRQPTTVTVTGEVYNASAFLFEDNKEVRDYLREAGGPQRDADSKRMFVVRADGSVVSRQYNKVERAQIFAGDTIILPPRLSHGNALRNTLLIGSVIGTLATPIALLAVLMN